MFLKIHTYIFFFPDYGACSFPGHVLCLHQRTTSQEDKWFSPWRPPCFLTFIRLISYGWSLLKICIWIVNSVWWSPLPSLSVVTGINKVGPGWSLDVWCAAKHSPTSIKHGHAGALGLIFNAVWRHCRHEVVVLLIDLHSFNNVCFSNVSQLFGNHVACGKQDHWFCFLCDAV